MIVVSKNTDKPNETNYWCEPGQPYFVYAIIYPTDNSEEKSFMINISEGNSVYDVPANTFNVLDSSTPTDWEEGVYEAYGIQYCIKTFPEWSRDKYFYEKLWDDDPETNKVFKQYAEKYEKVARDFDKQ